MNAPNDNLENSQQIKKAHKLSEKIKKQFVRFYKMDTKALLGYSKGNRFSIAIDKVEINNQSFYYGQEGRDFFWELADLFIELYPKLRGRVEDTKVFEELKSAYAKHYIIAKDNEFLFKKTSITDTKNIFQTTYENIKSTLKKHRHYIPCIVFSKPNDNKIPIGPVKFIKTSYFIANYIPEEWYNKDNEEYELYIESIEYYKKFPWVACVDIEESDYKSSYKIASYSCTTALNIIRIIFGSELTEDIRICNEASKDTSFANIYSVSNEQFKYLVGGSFTLSIDLSTHQKCLYNEHSTRIIDFLGIPISNLCNFAENTELENRLLDAINWFGDACQEKSDPSAIIKYTTAIERLFLATENRGDIKKRFVDIISKVLSDFHIYEKSKIETKANKIYVLRSKFVHGGISPITNYFSSRTIAEDIAKHCIMCSEQLYRIINDAFAPRNLKEFNQAIEKYKEEGLDWCIYKAKKNIGIVC